MVKEKESICLVAILKDEEKFLDEWLIYHRLLGIDHFFLYDDGPGHPLKNFVIPFHTDVSVIDWSNSQTKGGLSKQVSAYRDAYEKFILEYDWVVFLDGDEFIVVDDVDNIKNFLKYFKNEHTILLNWHVFGHNGYYDDPCDLITSSLIRRMRTPSRTVKSITRPSSIKAINSAHFCEIKDELPKIAPLVNTRPIAHINHYQSRSFTRWMNRIERGYVSRRADQEIHHTQLWKNDRKTCLRQFVSTVAREMNEFQDDYMLKFKDILEKEILLLGRTDKIGHQ